MVIVQVTTGFGNQFYQYALGTYFAHKLNTELKLDLSWYVIGGGDNKKHSFNSCDFYQLDDFNITAAQATPEEIAYVKKNGTTVAAQDLDKLISNLENFKGDLYLSRYVFFFNHRVYYEVLDILRKEFTLKNPLSETAESYRQKILSAECSVSLHLRYGNYAYSQVLNIDRDGSKPWMNVTPLAYAYTSIEALKKIHGDKKITVFVFSDSMTTIKENLRLDVPMEFVEGCRNDAEEWILMRLCQDNITSGSCFSKSAILLNSNPNKKAIYPKQAGNDEIQKYLAAIKTDKNFLLNSGESIVVPCNYLDKQKLAMRPIFSLLLVVNDDATTIAATLDSLLNQDYDYCEIIIIDNASTDGSGKICREAIANKENVTYKRFYSRVKNAEAYNTAMHMAQGSYFIFLKGNDRFLTNTFSSLYPFIMSFAYDVVHSFNLLEENANGTVTFGDKKCSTQRDSRFKEEKRGAIISKDGLNQQINSFLGTKIFECNFLKDNGIKFDENLDNDSSELFFQVEAFFKSKCFMCVANAFYVAPF